MISSSSSLAVSLPSPETLAAREAARAVWLADCDKRDAARRIASALIARPARANRAAPQWVSPLAVLADY